MNRNNIPLLLMLTAGAVTCVITFVQRYEMHKKLIILLIVFLVFYGLGSVIKWTLDSFDRQNQKEDPESEEDALDADGTDAEQRADEEQEV